MSHSSTITTTYTRPLAAASTSSPPYVSMAGARQSMPRGGGASSSGSMYSTRALEDASLGEFSYLHLVNAEPLSDRSFLGYVSPYPPVRPTAGPSAAQSTFMQSISESASGPNQDASENVREFTLPSSLSEKRRRYQVFPSPYETEAFSQVCPRCIQGWLLTRLLLRSTLYELQIYAATCVVFLELTLLNGRYRSKD